MTRKYDSPLTAKLTADNWKEHLGDVDRFSLDELIDILGDMKKVKGFATMVEGYLKEIVKARMPDDAYESPRWVLERNLRVRAGGLNRDLILEEMGEDWVEEHSNEPTEYTELRMKRKEES